jgi:hypothetical protein
VRLPGLSPLAVVLAVGLAACGTPSDDKQIRSTVALFARASAARDYPTLCQRVLAPTLVSKLKIYNLPCPVALRDFLGPVRQPQARVTRVTITGRGTAIAEVRASAAGQAPAITEFRLVKTPDGWRIASPGGPAPGPPSSRTPGTPSRPGTPVPND